MSRRFITKQDIDTLADAGEQVLEVDDQVTVTDVAREHARERDVRIVARDRATTPAALPSGDASVRERVRRAVIAQLGVEPEQLEAVIDRALERRDL
jgi:hypothetical protein